MKKNQMLGTLILTVCLALFVTSMNVTAKSENVKRVIVVFNDNSFDLSANYNFQSLKKLNAINGVSGIVSENSLKALKNDPRVKYVANDDVFTVTAETLPWGIERVNANDVWTGFTGAGIKVAILDTGIDIDHPDLVANIKGGYNTVDTAKSYDDDNGHGTHVAGTIAAVDNEIGVVGVAPQADLYAVKVLNRRGSGYTSDIIDGINWAVNNGMNLISMSLGGGAYNQAFNDAIQNAYANGVIVVAANGNDGVGTVSYPAAYDHVISVAATDSSNLRASFSNYGPQTDIAAPGVDIMSTYYGSRIATMSGTSMATPHVTGVIALMLQAGTAVTYEDVIAKFAATSVDLGAAGKDDYYGYGLVDAYAATR